MIKLGRKEVNKPIEYNLVVKRYNSNIPVTTKYIGPVPKGKTLGGVWNEVVNEFMGKDYIELDENCLSDDVQGSNYIIQLYFIETNSRYNEYHTKPLLDVNAAGFHRCNAYSASIIECLKRAYHYSDLMVLKDVSGCYYINDAGMDILSDLDKEHEPKHLKGSPDHEDNYFVIGDHCFNAKSYKNYYEFMESLIGPRPWMVE